MIFGQFNKSDRLITTDRRKTFQEIVERRIALDMIDQGLNRHASSFETRLAAQPFGIDPDNVVQQGLLLGGHIFNLDDLGGQGKSGAVTSTLTESYFTDSMI